MGCCSSDSLPPVPKNIKPDPDVGRQLTVVVRRLGVLWGRDYSVHEGAEYPKDSNAVRETMWLWFNKSNGRSPREAIIDLENFNRGNKEDKDKGGILYTARIDDQPMFEKFHRIVGSGSDGFFGFYSDPSRMMTYDDYYYVNHPVHAAKRNHMARDLTPMMITKWRLMTKAFIKDGDLGRAADLWQKDEVVLDVFSTGTVVTSWQEVERRVEDTDGDGRVIGHHIERDIVKHETEFVDRVEYRLVFRGQLWGEWMIQGDSMSNMPTDIAVNSPFFNTSMIGGFFKPNQYVISTLAGVDGAFAILLSHLCCTEYSVESIKKDLDAGTPSHPPHNSFSWGPGSMNTRFGGTPTQGTFNGRW